MFDATQPVKKTWAKTKSAARPNKNCCTPHNWAEAHHWAQCYSLNNCISHWCKACSFYWTTQKQDTLHITGADYAYDLM